MKRLKIAGLFVVFIWIGSYFYSCRNNDLRGWWKDSLDGKTYLVIDNSDGTAVDTKFMLDGQPWSHAVGQRGEIEPGCHYLDGIGFCVKVGTEFRLLGTVRKKL